MKNLQWNCRAFHQINTSELYDLLKLRIDVFVVEQNCPYPELDDKDQDKQTHHITAYADNTIIAYARLLPPGLSYQETSIGRFVVHEDHRRQGIGSLLLETCLTQISNIWPNQAIRISAQEYLQSFYERAGFSKVSDIYLEDGIPHIEMLKQ